MSDLIDTGAGVAFGGVSIPTGHMGSEDLWHSSYVAPAKNSVKTSEQAAVSAVDTETTQDQGTLSEPDTQVSDASIDNTPYADEVAFYDKQAISHEAGASYAQAPVAMQFQETDVHEYPCVHIDFTNAPGEHVLTSLFNLTQTRNTDIRYPIYADTVDGEVLLQSIDSKSLHILLSNPLFSNYSPAVCLNESSRYEGTMALAFCSY